MLVVIPYRNIIVGGCELLIERISRQLISYDYEVIIPYQTCDSVMKERFIKINTKLMEVKNWNRPRLNEIPINMDVRVITFSIGDYSRFCKITTRTKALIYTVHYMGLSVNNPIKKNIFSWIIPKLRKNNTIVVMDEQTNRYTQNTYRNIENSFPIIRIPIDDSVFEDSELIERSTQQPFNILSIARAEFPFKGYLIGLVNRFEKWKRENDNLCLTIISYGPNIEQLNERIKELDTEVSSAISLIGKTDKAELLEYYKKAKLYIGMGTTVLEASQRGIPSIAVNAYSYDLVAEKFFCDDNTQVATEIDEANNKIEQMISRITKMEQAEYYQLEIRSYETVKNDYSIKHCTDLLMSQFERICYTKGYVPLIPKYVSWIRKG